MPGKTSQPPRGRSASGREPPSEPAVASYARVSGPALLRRAAGPSLVLLAVAAFAPALRNGFVNWDDGPYIVINRTLDDAGNGLPRIWFEPRSTPIYYPMVFTTFWIERQLDMHGYLEEHPWQRTGVNWNHAFNMLLHGLAGLLLWRVLLRLRMPAGAAWATAAIWVVHPMQVESVAWAVERKNTLAAVFYFAAVVMWLRADGNMKKPSYAAALALFACMMLSKTAFVGLVLTLPLLEWLRGRTISRRTLVATLPFVVVGVLMLWLWDSMGGELLTVDPPPPASRLMIAGQALWFYLYKLIWPIGLTTVYPRWDTTVTALGMLPLIAAIGAGIAWLVGTAATARRRSLASAAVLVGVFQYVVTVGPALGLVPWPHTDISFVANHFTYVGLAGPIALLVLGARAAWRRVTRGATGTAATTANAATTTNAANATTAAAADPAEEWGGPPCPPTPARPATESTRHSASLLPAHPVPAATVAVLIVALGTASYVRSLDWYDAPTLANAILEVNPGCPEALALLSMVAKSEGRRDEAIARMRQALDRRPKYPEALIQYAQMIDEQGRTAEAIACAQRAAELQPDVGRASLLAAEWLEKAGRYQEAVEWATRTLAFPEMPPAVVLGLKARCLGRLKRYEEALAAARLMPPSLQREQLIAATLIEMGRPGEAVQVLTGVIQRIGPDPQRPDARQFAARAHLSRARALLTLQRPEQAEPDLRRAVELDPRLEAEAARLRGG